MRVCNSQLGEECKRRNKLRDYKRVFCNEKLLFRNGIIISRLSILFKGLHIYAKVI